MPSVSCPQCGNAVKVPHVMTDTRYHCRECGCTFHLDRAHRPVLGEPTTVEDELDQLKQKARETIGRFPTRKVLAGAAAALIVGVPLYLLLRPAEPLERPAERAAQAIADENPRRLKSMAVSGTGDDVERWFEEIRPRLAETRQTWNGRTEVVDVRLGSIDPEEGLGNAVASIKPAPLGAAPQMALADPSVATASVETPFEVEMVWKLDRWGRWKIDGEATYSKVHGGPPPEAP